MGFHPTRARLDSHELALHRAGPGRPSRAVTARRGHAADQPTRTAARAGPAAMPSHQRRLAARALRQLNFTAPGAAVTAFLRAALQAATANSKLHRGTAPQNGAGMLCISACSASLRHPLPSCAKFEVAVSGGLQCQCGRTGCVVYSCCWRHRLGDASQN